MIIFEIFLGSKGAAWNCLSMGFYVYPLEDFYFLIGAHQTNASGNGTFAIDEVRMSENGCKATCMFYFTS